MPDERQLKDEETDFLLTEVASSADFIKIRVSIRGSSRSSGWLFGCAIFAWSGRSSYNISIRK